MTHRRTWHVLCEHIWTQKQTERWDRISSCFKVQGVNKLAPTDYYNSSSNCANHGTPHPAVVKCNYDSRLLLFVFCSARVDSFNDRSAQSPLRSPKPPLCTSQRHEFASAELRHLRTEQSELQCLGFLEVRHLLVGASSTYCTYRRRRATVCILDAISKC